MRNLIFVIGFVLSTVIVLFGQIEEHKYIKDVNVTQTKAVYLGLTKPASEIEGVSGLKTEKRYKWKSKRQVPDNFKGRGKSKVIHPELEHQGPDRLRQTSIPTVLRDPTALGVSSRGDPIILYDEQTSQWIITEFAGPAELLIAVSETSSPLGSYHVYRFSTPNFPDYPKYGIWSDHLVVTSNEIGTGSNRLHQYFIDREALMTGAEDVALQRVEIVGTTGSEQNFIVSTPVDWNGPLEPLESSPIVLLLDDSSWGNAPEDGLRFFRFNVDMENESNTTVDEVFIPLSPSDEEQKKKIGVYIRKEHLLQMMDCTDGWQE